MKILFALKAKLQKLQKTFEINVWTLKAANLKINEDIKISIIILKNIYQILSNMY